MNLSDWPAFADAREPLPPMLPIERGVWGKAHDAESDYRWLVKTPGFGVGVTDLEGKLNLGPEDAPRPCVAWRTLGDRCFAISVRRSPNRDRAGREGGIEKFVIEWRRQEGIPNALAALLLLPLAASDWGQLPEAKSPAAWRRPSFHLELREQRLRRCEVSESDLRSAAIKGARALVALGEQDLVSMFASVLSDLAPASLGPLGEPLSAQALAALLLPLSAARGDELSAAGWVPSERVRLAELAKQWDVVGVHAGVTQDAPDPSFSPEILAAAGQAFRLLVSIATASSIDGAGVGAAADADADHKQLVLWGPSASGKTVLLGMMYLGARDGEQSRGWRIYPADTETNDFLNRADERMQLNNQLPRATVPGALQHIAYRMENPSTGASAVLALEDRAGADHEARKSLDRMKAANGLAILIDPERPERKIISEVDATLRALSLATGTRQDGRPLAVCLAKCDLRIHALSDLERVREDPDGFTREHLPAELINKIGQFFSRVRYFPVSAVGLRAQWGAVKRATFLDERLMPRVHLPEAQAINVLEPFSWLAEQAEASA